MMKKLVKILCIVLALLFVTACGEEEIAVSEENIMLSVTEAKVKMGETKKLEVLDFSGKVKWKSADNSIAKVSEDGVVTAVAKGPVAITAELDNGMSLTCKVTVEPGESKIESLKVGHVSNGVSDFTHNCKTEGVTVKLKAITTPENINEPLSWTSDDESIATVDENGLVTICGNGFATIKATAINGVEGICIVRTKNFAATGSDSSNQTDKPTQKPVKGDDKGAVSTVEESDGTVPKIEEKEEEKKNEFTAPVPQGDPTAKSKVVFSDERAYLEVGESLKLTYDVANSENKTLTWSSSDKRVAIVSDGRIVAVGAGRCVVSAISHDGAVASCSVAVGEDAIKELKKEVKK